MENYNPFSLEGKIILVTGASSGIGRAIAIECSRMGANVIITARNEQRLQETLAQMEGKHEYIVADLLRDEDITQLVNCIDSVTGIVNCAGITQTLPFQFVDTPALSNIMSVNFITPTILTARLVKQKKISKGGSIVFISSVSGKFVSIPANSMYTASKGAIDGIAKGMALDLAPKKIRVNTINPGMIETNIMSSGVVSEEQLTEDAKTKYPLKRYGKPEEVAYIAVYLLSDASVWMTGSNIVIDGGLSSQ